MSLANIRAALEIRLQSLGPLRTAWENVQFTPIPNEPYQKANLLPAQTQNPALGSSLKHETGVFQVTLYYPANKGVGDALARAQAIRDHFPRGLTLTQSGTTVTIQRTPSLGAGTPDGDRWVVPITIQYYANEF